MHHIVCPRCHSGYTSDLDLVTFLVNCSTADWEEAGSINKVRLLVLFEMSPRVMCGKDTGDYKLLLQSGCLEPRSKCTLI